MEADGEESTMAKPIIKKDVVYGISAEKTHDVQVRWDNLVFIGMQHIFDDGSARYRRNRNRNVTDLNANE
jgi:hypothetical protein